MENEIILRATDIVKYFHEPVSVQILRNVSFEVEKGEFLSVVGKSGCGKSTLLYILSTMDTDYEGELEIKGSKIKNWKQDQLALFRGQHLGFVFQFHYLLPEFTALKNVMLPALKAGRFSHQEIEAKAIEKLKLVDMDDHALKRSALLSGGQQQRVAIARALINDPDIIMGDEPTGNLDKTNSQKVFDILQKLAIENKQTIIAVTHDNDFAQNSDRIIEMSDGKIVGTHEISA